MDLTEKTLKTKEIFEGRIFRVHVDDVLLPDGSESKREIVEHSGGVCIAALNEKNQLAFVRQFRYPYSSVLLELPAGKLEKGEDPLEAGMRELGEECGVKAENVRSMGVLYPTVAYCSEIIHLFLATGLVPTTQHLDEGEFLTVEYIDLDEAVELVMKGEIPDSKSQALILKVALLKSRGEI